MFDAVQKLELSKDNYQTQPPTLASTEVMSQYQSHVIVLVPSHDMGTYYLNSLSFSNSILDRINRFDTSVRFL